MSSLFRHWSAKLRARLAPDTQQSAEVQDSLVRSLYASPASLMIGAVAGGALSYVVAHHAQRVEISAIAALIFLVALSRSVSAVYFQRELAHQDGPTRPIWGLAYELGAWGYAALLGLLAFATLTLTEDASLHILSVCLVAAYSGGIAGRNAGRVHIAIGQTCFALLPTTLGLCIAGGLGYWVLATMLFLMIFAMAEITRTTHRIVVEALQGKYEKSQLATKFERLARFDSLTGVENRMAMQMRLRDLFDRRRSDQDAMAVFWMDLDRFKEINDSLGHIIGDQLLCSVAARLSHAVDDRGYVARFGGDEFILICPGADSAVAEQIAADIMAEFVHDFDVSGYHLTVTASMGIAVAPDDGRGSEELLQHADMALYKAKHDGRNRHARFSWSMKERQNRTYELEMGLRTAMANGELLLHYQPIFDTVTGKIAICEALMRWDHPVMGRISPAEFIPIAESSSLIESITAWALEQACRDAMHWEDHVRVAVNISPALIKSDGLPRAVIAALLGSGLKARRLELEVTESIFLEDSGRTSLILSELQRIGLRLALDDFGTGYSSLGYLRDYAFDTLKVDQSFMRGVGESGRDRAIAQSVAYLAHSLDVETVAEGIETEEQLRYAREMGFSNVQGFVLSKPMTADDLLEMMGKMKRERSDVVTLMKDRRRA
ncbi:Histidine kinase [Sphingobium herbicidovorans NBRC 16415]|uniref:Histidine kinase n=1 Tax=Sphingobium herbicidovorans (strain ATCC 700291 / DSM 11019 / CCUG 56400 / KCTC 2939 / LMG 18315 / NBRC 16415 / MH) TaxID=1219045 RepID=A0A086PFB9_SPHHM|nr:bifunctional diguanylate cyclase/phosphodiesterase [Sphingobium herbicidovorans]KFG92087.1 Histidine kinase [Sphingobium herbicidovorans NBRC 16415]